jgi:hypothetical protein
MNLQGVSEEKKELVRAVILKALKDASYKERLVNNPMDAIKELYPDFYVGGNKKLVVVDQSDKDTYFVNVSHLSYILFDGDLDEFELTEEELEMVAGGATPAYSCYILSCFGAAQAE